MTCARLLTPCSRGGALIPVALRSSIQPGVSDSCYSPDLAFLKYASRPSTTPSTYS